MTRPALSVVIPTRVAWSTFAGKLDALAREVGEVGGEIVVVGTGSQIVDTRAPVRVVPTAERDMLRLRSRAVREATGEIVAIGEDHTIPVPGWCRAVIQAHQDHPDAAAIVGCLRNATNDTVSGRANFLAFAAPYAPPMPSLPRWRPPPMSTLTFKREALADLDDRPGRLEAELVPRLFREGRLEADDRVVVLHHQDHGSIWAVRNTYWGTRAGYGHAEDRLDRQRRREIVRWVLTHMPWMIWHEAKTAHQPVPGERGELAIVACSAAAATVGAIVGTLFGPGQAPSHVA